MFRNSCWFPDSFEEFAIFNFLFSIFFCRNWLFVVCIRWKCCIRNKRRCCCWQLPSKWSSHWRSKSKATTSKRPIRTLPLHQSMYKKLTFESTVQFLICIFFWLVWWDEESESEDCIPALLRFELFLEFFFWKIFFGRWKRSESGRWIIQLFLLNSENPNLRENYRLQKKIVFWNGAQI